MPGWEISGSRLAILMTMLAAGAARYAPARHKRGEGGFAAERNSGLRAGIADDEIGIDPHLLTVANNRDAVDAAVCRVNLHRRRRQPDVAIALDRRPERVPDADRALRAKAKPLEGALASEIGQKGARRQFGGVAGKDRGAEVAEDRVHRGVAGVSLEPVLGRLSPVGKVAGTGVGEFLEDARGLLGQLPEQQGPAAAADIDQLAVDEEGTGGLRHTNIERRADGVEGFLEHAAKFDCDRADIDRKAVDLLGRGAAADAVLVVDHEGMEPGMGQPSCGAQPASAGTDNDSIGPNNRHSTSQSVLHGLAGLSLI